MAGDILQKTKNKERERKMKQIVEADKIIIHKIANTYVLYSKDSKQSVAISEDDVVTRLLNLGYKGEEIENILSENSEKDYDDSEEKPLDEDLINKIVMEGQSFYIGVEYDIWFDLVLSSNWDKSESQVLVGFLKEDDKYYYIIYDEKGESIDGLIYRDLYFLIDNVKKIIVEIIRDEMCVFEDDEDVNMSLLETIENYIKSEEEN